MKSKKQSLFNVEALSTVLLIGAGCNAATTEETAIEADAATKLPGAAEGCRRGAGKKPGVEARTPANRDDPGGPGQEGRDAEQFLRQCGWQYPRLLDRMAALAPQNPVPLGYAAELCLKQDDRPGAMARFRRAFQLDPAYELAGLSLFDLLIEEGNLEEAQAVLITLQRYAQWEWVAAREVRLALRQGRSRGYTVRRLQALFGLTRPPLARWISYFRQQFPQSRGFRRLSGRLMPPVAI